MKVKFDFTAEIRKHVEMEQLTMHDVCRICRRLLRELVGDNVEEVKWKGLGVNDHWQQMKGIMMEEGLSQLN